MSHWVSGKFIDHTAFDPSNESLDWIHHCYGLLSLLVGILYLHASRCLRKQNSDTSKCTLIASICCWSNFYINGNLSNKMWHAGWILSVTCNFCRLFRTNCSQEGKHQGWGKSQAKEGNKCIGTSPWHESPQFMAFKQKRTPQGFNKCCITENQKKNTKQQQKKQL